MTLLSALQDLFRRHREGATGQWSLGSDPQRNIFFDGGRIVFATSTHPLDRLTHLLVEKGRLTQDQMDYALANLQPGMSVGKNLIQLGFITQRDLLDMARLQVERVVWGALGTLEGIPEFKAGALDKNVVRLNLDTPSLLLGGILNLKDRERLLELLGPLTQGMTLDRVRLASLELPPDLARIPALINGRRSLLELSRDAGTEPVRLGAFVLFLLEMGWGQLQEKPEPTTEDLLNLPLEGADLPVAPLLEDEPEFPAPLPPIQSLSLSQDLDRPGSEPAGPPPPLFEGIQAAASTTHNLEHLANSLDQMEDLVTPEPMPTLGEPILAPVPEPEEEPALVWPSPSSSDSGSPIPYQLESGQAVLPPPRLTLPFPPEPSAPLPPGPSLSHSRKERTGPRWGLVGGLALLLGLGIAAGYWWMHRRPTATPEPVPSPAPPESHPAVVPAETKHPEPATQSVKGPETPVPGSAKPAPKPEPKPEPKPAIPPPAEPPKGFAKGLAKRATLPKDAWALRLEIACQEETVRHASKLLEAAGQEYFLLPIKMKDGKTCTQIFQGPFPSREAADSHAKALPQAFRDGGNRPRPYLVSEIPDKQ